MKEMSHLKNVLYAEPIGASLLKSIQQKRVRKNLIGKNFKTRI
jgi:hypothetical protein